MAKPRISSLAIVTATAGADCAQACMESWRSLAAYEYPTYTIKNIWGVVPAYAQGVRQALDRTPVSAVLCLHDDLLIEEQDWDLKVLDALDRGVRFGGFGGAVTLGAENIYRTPYDPMQLARGGFVSNMRDAEAHGVRSTVKQPCVCFDGYSQLGTSDWFGAAWNELERLGFKHHAYDSALGCLARRARVKAGELIPVACHHYGGRTAVLNTDYHAWAKQYGGDAGLWDESHRIMYDAFKHELPLRLTRAR